MAAIDQVQGQIASGQTTPQDGDQLIANIKSSLDARTRGFTPEQLQQNQQQQASFGQGILDKMTSGGNTQANTLLNAARGARDLGGAQFTPYQNSIAMGGGPDMIKQALSLIQQVQPINDRAGALDAAGKYGQASQIFKQAIAQITGQGGSQPQGSAPTPDDQGDPNAQASQQQQAAMAAGASY